MSKIEVYDYVVCDVKLLAYNSFHRHEPITNFLNIIMRALIFNKIKYKKLVFAHDINKSEYRLSMYPDYKGHRKEVQSRDSDKEQSRRDEFIAKYKRLPTILKYIGLQINQIQGITNYEADDVISMIRGLEPDAKILGVSLDADWILNVDANTHILKYTTNTLITDEKYCRETYDMGQEDLKEAWSVLGQCVDGNTEFMTGTGWKKIKDFKKGDKVLQVHPETRKATLVEPTKYIHNYNPMDAYHIEGDNRSKMNMVVSSNHRVIHNTKTGDTKITLARDLLENVPDNTYIPSNFTVDNTEYPIPDVELRLMVAYSADGYIKPSGVLRHSFNLKKDRKKHRLTELLEASGRKHVSNGTYLKYDVDKYSLYSIRDMKQATEGYSRFSFTPYIDSKLFHTWAYKLSNRQLGIVKEESVYWDGWKDPRTHTDMVCTAVKEEADFFQYCYQACTRGSITIETHIKSTNTTYVVREPKAQNKIVRKGKIVKKPMESNMEYCFEVPSGAWVARRDDYIFLTGNSKDGIHGISNIGLKRWAKHFAPLTPQARYEQLEEWLMTKKFGCKIHPKAVFKDDWRENWKLNEQLMSFMTLHEHTPFDIEYAQKVLKGDDVEAKISYREWLELSLLELEEIPPMTEEVFMALQNSIHRKP